MLYSEGLLIVFSDQCISTNCFANFEVVKQKVGWCELTCCHGAHQHSVEFDDGAEDVFGVCRAGQVFTVTLQDQPLILFL